ESPRCKSNCASSKLFATSGSAFQRSFHVNPSTMEAAPCGGAVASASASAATITPREKMVSFIVNLLNADAHNSRAFRTGCELLPGVRGRDYRTCDLVKDGHLQMLRIRLARLKASSQSRTISKKQCNSTHANAAAG